VPDSLGTKTHLMQNHFREKATLFLILFVDILGFTVLVPFLPFFSKTLGATPVMFSLIVVSYGLASMVAGPILGAWSDRVGRRKVLLISQIGTLLGLLIIANATTTAMLFFGRVLDGFTAGNYSVAAAYFSDLSHKKDRTQAFALVGIAFGLGFLGGPALSGFLSGKYGEFAPIYVAASFSFVSILGTLFFLKESKPKNQAHRSLKLKAIFDIELYLKYLRNPKTVPYLAEIFVFQIGFSSFFWGFPMFAAQRITYQGHYFGQVEIGYTYAFAGLIGLFVQGGLLKRMVRRYGEWRLIAVSFLLVTIAYLAMGFADTLISFACAVTGLSIGNSILRPAITGSLSLEVSDSEQGAVLGVSQSTVALAQIFGPMLAGVFIQQHWYHLWGISLAFLMGGILLVHLMKANRRPLMR